MVEFHKNPLEPHIEEGDDYITRSEFIAYLKSVVDDVNKETANIMKFNTIHGLFMKVYKRRWSPKVGASFKKAPVKDGPSANGLSWQSNPRYVFTRYVEHLIDRLRSWANNFNDLEISDYVVGNPWFVIDGGFQSQFYRIFDEVLFKENKLSLSQFDLTIMIVLNTPVRFKIRRLLGKM